MQMGLADNIKLEHGTGEACLVCDGPTKTNQYVFSIVVNFNVFFVKKQIRAEVHIACGVELRNVLNERIEQAKKLR